MSGGSAHPQVTKGPQELHLRRRGPVIPGGAGCVLLSSGGTVWRAACGGQCGWVWGRFRRLGHHLPPGMSVGDGRPAPDVRGNAGQRVKYQTYVMD